MAENKVSVPEILFFSSKIFKMAENEVSVPEILFFGSETVQNGREQSICT